jgi:6-pyruvoyltetrahydropterin/6-carboxytetrahydropterin synthase
MFTLKKTFNFEAAHLLTYHDGKCARPHGHSYELTLTFQGKKLQESGPKQNMLIDFQDISTIVKPLIEKIFDHHDLNKTLNTDSPTSEYIAKWIYDYLALKFPELTAVKLKETASSSVTYTP